MTKRSTTLLWIAMGAFAIGFIASGYLNVVQYKRAQDDTAALKGQITDLRYQLKQSPATSAASPSPAASPIAIASPSASPTVAGAQLMAISQLGVVVTPSDPIADLTYAPTVISGLAVANFTTASLQAKYPRCTPQASLGQLVRRPLTGINSKPATSASKLVKQLGNFNYYYVPYAGTCTNDVAGTAQLKAARAALLDTVLPTLVATP